MYFVEDHKERTLESDKDENLGYCFQNSPGDVAKSHSAIRKCILGWHALTKDMIAPRTMSDMLRNNKVGLDHLAKIGKPVRLSTAYFKPWISRGYQVDLMEEAGVKRLKVDSSVSVKGFLNLAPDQKQNLVRIYHMLRKEHAGGKLDVKRFLQLLGCSSHQRPELCSYYTCFAGDPGLLDTDFECESPAEWCVAADKMRKETGIEPHPTLAAQRSAGRKNAFTM